MIIIYPRPSIRLLQSWIQYSLADQLSSWNEAPRSAGERLWGLVVAPGTERGAEVSAQIVVEPRSLLPPEKLQEEVDLRRLFLASSFFCFFYVLFLLQIISRKIVDKR